MTEKIGCHMNKIKLGAQQSYKNLTIFPLLTIYSSPRNCLTMIAPMSKCNTELNRSAYITTQNHENDRITTSWDYVEQFARLDGQMGAIFLINGKWAGMVCFRSPEEFKKSFIEAVECYAKMADESRTQTIFALPSIHFFCSNRLATRRSPT